MSSCHESFAAPLPHIYIPLQSVCGAKTLSATYMGFVLILDVEGIVVFTLLV